MARRDNMKDICVVTDDRVGLLADISYILGKSRVNIDSIAVSSVGGKAVFSIMVKDQEKARSVLEGNGFSVSSGNVIFVKLEDQPGRLAEIAKLLSGNRISVENLHLISRDGKNSIVGITVSRPRKARKLLSGCLIENDLP
ncbi:ACT domain-containing protein [Candidatus Micrarchaeota archaeon]|nr:ACT domain-containing protein [Candidatus Micrarchaeota archaeon]